MNRRELIFLLAGLPTATRAVRAQQKAMPVIGWLSSGSPLPTSATCYATQSTREWAKWASSRVKT
jgi:hypothetical protein